MSDFDGVAFDQTLIFDELCLLSFAAILPTSLKESASKLWYRNYLDQKCFFDRPLSFLSDELTVLIPSRAKKLVIEIEVILRSPFMDSFRKVWIRPQSLIADTQSIFGISLEVDRQIERLATAVSSKARLGVWAQAG